MFREEATLSATCFYLREVKDDNKVILEDKDLEVIGVPNVRYDDVTVIAQHMETGFWLSYKAYQVKKKNVGLVEEKRLLLHEEGRMDDGCEFARSQDEEARTARVIRKCSALFNSFIVGLEVMINSKSTETFLQDCNLTEMVGSLDDLNNYFVQPEDDLSHEDRQKFLKALRNRQDLFQEEGILNLILDMIDKMNVITSQGLLSSFAGEEAHVHVPGWLHVLHLLPGHQDGANHVRPSLAEVIKDNKDFVYYFGFYSLFSVPTDL